MRVLTYSHDSYGLGHLRRSVTLARAMVERGPHVQVLCVSGSPAPDTFPLPERCELVKLPSVSKDAGGNYVARRLAMPLHELLHLRSEMLGAAVRAFRPVLVLVDHTANGPGGELLPVLRRLRHESRRTRIVLGLRDVLDTPVRARAELARNDTVGVIRACYDEVLVYGQREVFDVASEFGLPPDIAASIRYVGAVVPPETRVPVARAGGRLRVLVTAGGGEDGYDLLRWAIAAVRGPMRANNLAVTLVAGPLLANAAFAELEREVQGDPRCTLLRVSRAMHELMDKADLVVGMGGYNTVYENLARGLPFLALPRRGPRLEQWERCRRLAALGALTLLDHGDARDPQCFASAMREAAGRKADFSLFAFDGAERTAEHCLAPRTAAHRAPPLTAP
jgi:predicted glycosyltransferase